jgi:macrolide transport system ATP-binding/permease protein
MPGVRTHQAERKFAIAIGTSMGGHCPFRGLDAPLALQKLYHAGIPTAAKPLPVWPFCVHITGSEKREWRGILLLQTILQDLRFAARQLRRNAGFTLTAIGVFALAIAASTAIFGFVDAALVKPLPYRHPSKLVALFEHIPVGDRYHLSYPDYVDWKRLNRVFTALDVYRPEPLTLNTPGGTEAIAGATVSDGFFRTLGIAPVLGRDFRPGEDQPGAQQTVIVSYEAWRKRFGADANLVGRTITLGGDPYLIIGVLPAGFHFAPVGQAEFWRTLHGLCADSRTCYPYYGVARLKEGVSVQTAVADLAAIARQIAIEYPHSNRDRSATVLPLTDAILGDIRPILLALLSGAALLSLIGFVNVSSLLMARAESRRREIAVRGALGASRIRLARQFTVEAFLLGGAGCGIGMILASCSMRILAAEIPCGLLDDMPYLQGLHFNLHLVLFAVFASIFGSALFSVGPTVQLSLSNMQKDLMDGGRTAAGGSWRRIGASLVIFELSITVLLLMSAGLLAKSFYRLLHEDIGISADHLAVLHVSKLGDSTESENIGLERQILSRMSTLPGVTSAGISEQIAVGSGEKFAASFEHYRAFGRPYLGQGDEANSRIASVGYFETLRARLARGRYFTEADDASSSRVAIVNQTMAKQIFSVEDPVGKRIVSEYDRGHPLEIVGVINDIKEGPLDMEPTAAVYMPFNQSSTSDFYVTLRTSRPEKTVISSMINVVHGIGPGLIADGEDSMIERINKSQSAYLHRSAGSVLAGFALMALLLGTIGLYGVVSYSVAQRTREIGVRMALGAQRIAIYELVLNESGRLVILGITGGLLCSVAATRLLRSLLFGVSPWDIPTLLAVALVLVAAALLASYLPARRAASINPADALRAE